MRAVHLHLGATAAPLSAALLPSTLLWASVARSSRRPASSAPSAAAAPAAAASSSPPGRSPSSSLSASVRAVLRASPEPMRLTAIWDAVSQASPPGLRSRTHFKRRIVGAMEARGELVKTHVAEAVKGKGDRDFFAFRLKNITRNFPDEASAAAAAARGAGLR